MYISVVIVVSGHTQYGGTPITQTARTLTVLTDYVCLSVFTRIRVCEGEIKKSLILSRSFSLACRPSPSVVVVRRYVCPRPSFVVPPSPPEKKGTHRL